MNIKLNRIHRYQYIFLSCSWCFWQHRLFRSILLHALISTFDHDKTIKDWPAFLLGIGSGPQGHPWSWPSDDPHFGHWKVVGARTMAYRDFFKIISGIIKFASISWNTLGAWMETTPIFWSIKPQAIQNFQQQYTCINISLLLFLKKKAN